MMDDEKDQEVSPFEGSWPPKIQPQEVSVGADQINYLKFCFLDWAIIWILSVGRTGLLWLFFVYDIWADESGTYDMSVINSFGYKAFPEHFVVDLTIKSYNLTQGLLPQFLTLLVFLDTFIVGVIFRLIVTIRKLRCSRQ